MEQRNQFCHIFERKRFPRVNNLNAGVQFIKCKLYQIDTNKLIKLINILHYCEFDLIWQVILDEKPYLIYLYEVNMRFAYKIFV